MICGSCGRANDQGTRFCEQCGSRLANPTGDSQSSPILEGVSRAWFRIFEGLYRIVGWLDPPLRAAHHAYGIGNFVELRVPGRRSGRPRTTLLGLLRTNGQMYLGHPNGDCAWTLDLEAAGGGELVLRGLPPVEIRAVRLPPGPEREAVIRSTGQHPFPGNAIYRLGRRHVLAVGTYFRLEPRVSPA